MSAESCKALFNDEPRHSGTWLYQEIATAEDCGYFGPGSAIWSLHREAVLALGIERALFLQLAHPWVAQAVVDHSTYQSEPVERLFGTISTAELLIYGSRRQADAAAARVRKVHARLTGTLSEDVGKWRKGTVYRASDPAALLWVLATLIDTTLVVYESCFGQLPEETVSHYISDAARLGAMLELPPEMMLRNRESLRQYMQAMVADGTVAVGSQARRVAGAVLRPDLPRWTRIFWWPYRSIARGMTVTLMPEALRSQYGSLLTLHGESVYRAGGSIGRVLLHRLPARFRLDPIASTAINLAERRAA
jgi:uncharacterized protein (DUF2236 family)